LVISQSVSYLVIQSVS